MIEEHRKEALIYIHRKGYASYSSLTRVRDCLPVPEDDGLANYYTFGAELHKHFLEGKKSDFLSVDYEKIQAMLVVLKRDSFVKGLMKGAKVEKKFESVIESFPVVGFMDAVTNNHIVDLKTTQCRTKKAFVKSLDFLQPALYLTATKKKSFYYIGICKALPYELFIFNVNEYPERLAHGKEQLKELLTIVKEYGNERKT